MRSSSSLAVRQFSFLASDLWYMIAVVHILGWLLMVLWTEQIRSQHLTPGKGNKGVTRSGPCIPNRTGIKMNVGLMRRTRNSWSNHFAIYPCLPPKTKIQSVEEKQPWFSCCIYLFSLSLPRTISIVEYLIWNKYKLNQRSIFVETI
jgi:hypothetical protein